MPGNMTDRNIHVNTEYSSGRVESVKKCAHYVPMKNLRAIRARNRLSQVQLSEMVGCTQSMVSKIEKGLANPTLDLIEAIADALNVTPVALFGLPEAQQRAVLAMDKIDPALRESALLVLEKMAENSRQ